MEALKVNTITDIKTGDLLIIKGNFAAGCNVQALRVKQVKVTAQDGTEVILNKSKNVYFNLGMYLGGRSWVKEVLIIKS